jgi:hypothetical protein
MQHNLFANGKIEAEVGWFPSNFSMNSLIWFSKVSDS